MFCTGECEWGGQTEKTTLTQNGGNEGDKDDQHAQQTGGFGLREEGGDQIAEHHHREGETGEEEEEEEVIGELEHLLQHQRTARRNDQEFNEVNDQPRGHQRQVLQSLTHNGKAGKVPWS